MRSSPHPHYTETPAALRAAIARLEGHGFDDVGPPPIRLGVAAIDRHLPWNGLARGMVHDILGHDPLDGAASGFCTVLLARLGPTAGPVLWVSRPVAGDAAAPYGHGLARFGLDPARVFYAHADKERNLLWAVEEGLRTPALAAVVAETDAIDLTASRRLQLAAEACGVTAFLLRRTRMSDSPVAAATRWQVASVPSSPHDLPRWHLDLDRCRGGTPGNWLVEWCNETGDLALAADAVDRPDLPCLSRLAG